jgi:hypothetical protein
LFLQTSGGWIFQKNSPYVSLFNYFLDNFNEVGLLDKLMKKKLELMRAEACEESSFQAINFGNVILVFILLLIGIFASLVLLGIEYLKSYHYFKK